MSLRRAEQGSAGGVLTRSGSETEQVGEAFGGRLQRGDVVLVSGELGAGKTTFARGVCRALGVTGPVTSPTFTIGQVYEGEDSERRPLVVSHLDLYRLASLDEEDPGLIEDYLAADRIVLLEWPEMAAAPIGERATHRVEIEHAGGDSRRIAIG